MKQECNVGEIYRIGNSKYEYAMIVRKSTGANPIYTVAYLSVAKPYERDSVLCVGIPKSKRKEGIILGEKTVRKVLVSNEPFAKLGSAELSSLQSHIYTVEGIALQNIIGVINDRNACRDERVRLSRVKKHLHYRLAELTKKRELCRFNNQGYASIEDEMETIVRQLGYTPTQKHRKEQQFREAPSNYIKVYQGGRGG